MTEQQYPPTTTTAPEWWRPPEEERMVVAVIGALLAAALAFGVVFAVIRWEIRDLPGWGPGERYSHRPPGVAGLVAGVLSFFAVSFTIFAISHGRTRHPSRGRIVRALFGMVTASVLGFFCSYLAVSEPDERIRLLDRRFSGAARNWVGMNEAKALLAGICTGFGCGVISGASLFILFDQRDGPPSDENTSDTDKEQ